MCIKGPLNHIYLHLTSPFIRHILLVFASASASVAWNPFCLHNCINSPNPPHPKVALLDLDLVAMEAM